MDSQKIVIVFAVGLFAIGVLSACNLASRVTSQADQSGTAAAASNAVPTAMPLLKMNAAQPTASSTTMTKQPSTVANKPPTPTTAPMVQSSSKKQGDDLEQQLNQLLNGIDSTDTVNDASK